MKKINPIFKFDSGSLIDLNKIIRIGTLASDNTVAVYTDKDVEFFRCNRDELIRRWKEVKEAESVNIKEHLKTIYDHLATVFQQFKEDAVYPEEATEWGVYKRDCLDNSVTLIKEKPKTKKEEALSLLNAYYPGSETLRVSANEIKLIKEALEEGDE